MVRTYLFPSLSLVALLVLFPIRTEAQELTGRVTAETRVFPSAPLAEEQHKSTGSLAFQPELYKDWKRGTRSFTFTPYLRLDMSDPARSHFDIRELYGQYVARSWEIKVGLARVFWGVTESQHLVDIINQTDLVEQPDGEAKLGQPMVNLTWIQDWGTLDLFVLPWFRERTFPGRDGRLRFPLIINTDDADVNRRVDVATRYTRTLGRFDLGVSHFWGISREPRFILVQPEGSAPTLTPAYETIHQTGLDLQAVTGAWLWKLEAITRSGQGDRFYAFVGGFEYTLSNLGGKGLDLGLLAEYHYDSRDDFFAQGFSPNLVGTRVSSTPFDDDLFLGTRLALNDVQSTDLLGGLVIDRETQSTALLLEASRRLRSSWTLGLEIRSFLNTDTTDPLYSFRRDSYAQLQVSYHF